MTNEIIAIIKAIPRGKVMSYGQIAAAAGFPGAARQVVRILNSFSTKHDLPWHRVVNSKGGISLPEAEGGALQRAMLEQEGIGFSPTGTIAAHYFHCGFAENNQSDLEDVNALD